MNDLVSRRALLRAGLLGGAGLVLARCGTAVPTATPAPSVIGSATPTSPPSSGSPAASSAAPTSQPSATVAQSAGPSLEEQVAGLLVVGFRGARLADAPWVRDALRAGLGGVILFDRDQLTGRTRNVLSPAQVTALTRNLRDAAGRGIVVAVDQEGGIVTRLSPAYGFPAVASEATIGHGSVSAAHAWARTIATTLADAGFTLNFAPVVDLDVNPRSPAIGALDRSFSADPDVVVQMATIELGAHRAAGVRTALKHFPGIGSSTTNTDFGVADVTKTWSPRELEPFRRLIAAGLVDLVMAGHVVNGQLDPKRPASLSAPTVRGVLRGQLGWDGIVVTDDLQAVAITRSFGRDEAVILALEAGNDVLLFANQGVYEPGVVGRVVETVVAAVRAGRLSAAAIRTSWEKVQRLFGGTTR